MIDRATISRGGMPRCHIGGSSHIDRSTRRDRARALRSSRYAAAMPTVDRALVHELKQREDARFDDEHPRSLALLERGRRVMPNGVPMAWQVGSYHHPPIWAAEGHGARFSDVDGHTYSDFNIADMSMFCGYAPEPLLRAVSDRMARGHQFLLPVEDAIIVSEELSRRYGLPKWQYTLSASQANTEAIRVARVVTGRDKVLLFDGHYLGHFDQALVEWGDDGRLVPEERGVPAAVTAQTVLVPLNDVAALGRALERRDIALVLTEPALTNNFGLILPDPGYHDALRALTRDCLLYTSDAADEEDSVDLGGR